MGFIVDIVLEEPLVQSTWVSILVRECPSFIHLLKDMSHVDYILLSQYLLRALLRISFN